jgi:endonuclease G
MLVTAKNKECYIVSGPAGVGGTGKNGKVTKFANGKVTVPAFTWKVILVLPAGTTDPTKVKGSKARLIAVIVPNDRTPTLDWATHRASVEDVEELTDLQFFSKVTDPDFLDKKAEVDQIPIGPPIPVNHDD